MDKGGSRSHQDGILTCGKEFVTYIALCTLSATVIIPPQCENNINSIRRRESSGFKKWSTSTRGCHIRLVDMQEIK